VVVRQGFKNFRTKEVTDDENETTLFMAADVCLCGHDRLDGGMLDHAAVDDARCRSASPSSGLRHIQHLDPHPLRLQREGVHLLSARESAGRRNEKIQLWEIAAGM
jgi:hypothetical protein